MLKKVWSDPVWAAVIASVIFGGLSAGAVYVFDWAPRIGGVVSQAWQYLLADAVIPRWLIGLLVLLATPALVLVGVFMWGSRKPQPLSWEDYRSDQFYGLNWRWSYSGLRVVRLVSFCSRCDFQVYPQDSSYFSAVPRFLYQCDGCGARLGEFDGDVGILDNKVERSIHQKLRNGQWQQVVLSEQKSQSPI